MRILSRMHNASSTAQMYHLGLRVQGKETKHHCNRLLQQAEGTEPACTKHANEASLQQLGYKVSMHHNIWQRAVQYDNCAFMLGLNLGYGA